MNRARIGGLWLLAAVAAGAIGALGAPPSVASGADAGFVIPEVLRVSRVYSGADGESHFDEVELPRVGGERGRSVLTRLHATDVELGYSMPGRLIDFHGVTTPRLLIILQGQMEIGLGDGSRRILGKGDVVLAADTTGHGHTSRGIGAEPILALTVRLPKDDPLLPKTEPCAAGVAPKDCVGLNLRIVDPR